MSAELGAQVGPGRARRHHARLAGAARRAGRRDRALAQRRRRAGHAPPLRRLDAGAAGGAAAQPGQRARRGRRWSRTRIDIAYIGACTGAKLDDLRAAAQRARGPPHRRRTCSCWWRRPACATRRQAEREGVLRQLLDAGATLLPSACGACAGYGSRIPEGSTVDLVHRAQLQGPHGRGHGAGVPRLALHRGGVGAARRDQRSARGCWHARSVEQAASGACLPTSTPTSWRPGATMKHGIEVTARHCLEALRPEFAREVRPGDVIVAGAAFRHRLVARAGGQRAGAPGRGGGDRAVLRRPVLPQRLQRRPAAADLPAGGAASTTARRIAFDARAGARASRADGSVLRLRTRSPASCSTWSTPAACCRN